MAGKGKTINHAEVTAILGRAMKNPAFRKKLLASPKETLISEGYAPHAAAVNFFTALKKGKFDDAAKKFKAKAKAKPKVKHDPLERAGEM